MRTGDVVLGGVTLDDSLQLLGMETNEDIAYSVRDLLGGPSVIQVDQRDTGARLGLQAINEGTRKMAEYCQHEIESLKAIAALGQPVPLIHPYSTLALSVFILEFEVIQSDDREAPDPNKKFHGTIYLQEV